MEAMEFCDYSRRRFLFQTAAAALAGTYDLKAGDVAGARAPFRILYSNDTTNTSGCTSPWHRKGEPFRPELLEASVDEVAGLVDAHLLQPGLGEVPMWPSEVEPLEEHYRWVRETYGVGPDAFGKYVLGGGDVVKVFIDRCRMRGQAPFVSVRLNDAHHKEWVNARPGDQIPGSLGMAVTPFYHDHPEFRVGPKLGSAQFQVLNWAHPEVPARKLALITELCANYDLDGLELDFMRFHVFFPRDDSTTQGQRTEIITGFVREVRAVLDRTARGGKRRWLCARVPGFLSAHGPLGLDLAALSAAGLDMVNLSASYFTTQQMEVAAARELAPAAACYVELCHSIWNGEKQAKGYDTFPFRRATREQLSTTAHLAYARGADGVSLFNFAYYREHGSEDRGPFHEPPFDILKNLGDRAWLAPQPQHWFLAPGWENLFVKPPRPLPRKIGSGETVAFELEMAPPQGGWKVEARLRLQATEPLGEQGLGAKLNGVALAALSDASEPFPNPDLTMLGTPETLRAWQVPASALRDGKNGVEIAATGSAVEVAYLDVSMAARR